MNVCPLASPPQDLTILLEMKLRVANAEGSMGPTVSSRTGGDGYSEGMTFDD